MTDLLYSDVEEDLRANVREMLAKRCDWPTVLAGLESGRSHDSALWTLLATDLGCAGLAVPEEHGGAGVTWRETAVVLEELGRAVAPVPFLGSSVVATAALLAAGSPLVASLATGERIAALAVPFATAPGRLRPTVTGDESGLTGTITGVADAAGADLLLVPTDFGLYAVDSFGVSPVTSLDLTRPLCDVTLDGVPGQLVAPGTEAVEAGLLAGAGLLASEQLGVAEWCLSTTVEYVKTRVQFARPVGSFQALKHRLADLWVEVIQARAAARYAADCLARSDEDAPVAAAIAQAHCSRVAVLAAEECVQLHGGIGMTWEHPAHLYLKRAKSAAIAFGTPDRHRATLASLVNLPG